MTLHREGFWSILITLLVSTLLIWGSTTLFPTANYLHYFIYALCTFLMVVVLQFFRSPIFTVKQNDKAILCPADGKVVVIEEVQETEYFKDKRIQVSIFMSPINVHINRNPISGTVTFAKYHPGKFLVAWHPKSSTENERTSIAVKGTQGVEILFRQIAGALARRIKYYVTTGDTVTQGEEFGFIKFGSRVDVFLPIGTKINVGLDEVVKGGCTVLAELN